MVYVFKRFVLVMCSGLFYHLLQCDTCDRTHDVFF